MKRESVEGYLEWQRAGYLLADGQRVRWDERTRLRVGRITRVSDVPLGYEINVSGVRLEDGSILAEELEAKPNDVAPYENDVRTQHGEVEMLWLLTGSMAAPDRDGSWTKIGRILEAGPEVDRARDIVNRLLPPYVTSPQLRVRVVDSPVWNATAMGNGAIWVYRGLLQDTTDDELAIVLGHELAHYTHEHSRRKAASEMRSQLAVTAADATLNRIDSEALRDVATAGAILALSAWQSGYSRDLEDQADRIGLRYAHEGGFDVTAGPAMWARVQRSQPEKDRRSNFFAGTHSPPSDRIKSIERELALNYPTVQ